MERSPDERPCSKCGGEPRVPGQRWGKRCFAAWKRKNRPDWSELTDEEKRRAKARSTANVALRRGLLVKENCPCGSTQVQMHHRDYTKPLEVEWRCVPCHLAEHGGAFGGE